MDNTLLHQGHLNHGIGNSASLVPLEMPRWYAIRTRGRSERTVDAQLRAHGLQTFLPLYSEVRRWSDVAERFIDLSSPATRFFALQLARRSNLWFCAVPALRTLCMPWENLSPLSIVKSQIFRRSPPARFLFLPVHS